MEPADAFVQADPTRCSATVELVGIEGVQHGFAVHEDPQCLNPQLQRPGSVK